MIPFRRFAIPILAITLILLLGLTAFGAGVSKFQQLRATQTGSTGYALQVDRNLTSTSTNSPVVYLLNDHASDDQALLYLKQDGSGNLITADYGATANVFQLGNTGIATMRGGGTLDNTTSATVLNLTETTVRVTGALDVTGGFTTDTNAFAIADTTGIVTMINGATIDNNTSASILALAETTIQMTGAIAAKGVVTFDGGLTAAAHAGLLHGAGATNQAGAFSVGAAGGKAMSYYIKTTSATSTHALEGLYVRTYYGVDDTSVAPMGEAGRFFASIVGDAAAGTITGLHSSVGLSAGATNTGLTVGSRSNLILANEVVGAAGTYAGAQIEINTGGAASSLAGTTSSMLRMIIDGTAPTSAAQLTIPVIELVLPANLVGDGLIVDNVSATTANCVAKMRIVVNGTTYWVLLDDAAD